jgi:hypothetical protein
MKFWFGAQQNNQKNSITKNNQIFYYQKIVKNPKKMKTFRITFPAFRIFKPQNMRNEDIFIKKGLIEPYGAICLTPMKFKFNPTKRSNFEKLYSPEGLKFGLDFFLVFF